MSRPTQRRGAEGHRARNNVPRCLLDRIFSNLLPEFLSSSKVLNLCRATHRVPQCQR